MRTRIQRMQRTWQTRRTRQIWRIQRIQSIWRIQWTRRVWQIGRIQRIRPIPYVIFMFFRFIYYATKDFISSTKLYLAEA